MSEVVRLDAGVDVVRAYVSAQAAQGKAHVLNLVTEDNFTILRLIGDLTEDEGMTVTPVDIWRPYDVMKHMSASLDRSLARLATMSSGRPFENPVVQPGSSGSVEYESFRVLRSAYIDAMADIIGVVRGADAGAGLHLTANHAQYGSWNWLEWAVYSHHVHTHDHIGQLTSIVQALRSA